MSVSGNLRFRVFTRDRFTCQYCGRQAPDVVLEVDHRHPKSSGGKDTEANLVTACFDCNRGKYDMVIPRGIRLMDGPCDGEMFESAETFPVVWVYRSHAGEIVQVLDGWNVLRLGPSKRKAASYFPKLGHPVVGNHKHTATRGMWSKEGEYPSLLGFYDACGPGEWAREIDALSWSDADSLLVRFTDVMTAFGLGKLDEGKLFFDDEGPFY